MDAEELRPGATVWRGTDRQRRWLTVWCGAAAASGWLLLDTLFEVLYGPHVQLMRSLAIGSGIGGAAGLLTSGLQWLGLRSHVFNAAALIPLTTAASTLSGLVAGLFLYWLNHLTPLYAVDVPVQGAASAVFVGLLAARVQWLVLRRWAPSGRSWLSWLTATGAGTLLGVAFACTGSVIITGAVGSLLERRAWPYVLLCAYLAAAAVGSAIYGLFITRGLRRVLPPFVPGAELVDAAGLQREVEIETASTLPSGAP